MSVRVETVCLTLMGAIAATSGCAPNVEGDPVERQEAALTPQITALSRTEAAVGDEVRFQGEGFVTPDKGWVDVTFTGEFLPEDGGPAEPVDLTLALRDDGTGEIPWHRFGRYRIPFGSGHELGRFEGTVHATNRYFDGQRMEQPEGSRLLIRFDVKPSLVVMDFRAMGDSWYADCKDPTVTALNRVPYAMRVRALGFDPVEIEWLVSAGLLVGGDPTSETSHFRRETAEHDNGILVRFDDVPQHVTGYQARVTARVEDTEGRVHELDYPFVVRRPLQAYFTSPMRLAEIFPPRIAHSCIPGGPGGVHVNYSEMREETRTRSTQQEVSRGWTVEYGEEHSESWGASLSEGFSESATESVETINTTSEGGSVTETDAFTRERGRESMVNVGFSESSEGSWEYDIGRFRDEMRSNTAGGSVTAGGEAGIPLVANGKVEATGMYQRGWGHTERESEDFGIGGMTGRVDSEEESETTRESESETNSRAREFHWSQTQSYAEANSFTTARSVEASRDYGQAITRSQSIGESLGVSQTEIYTVSTSEAESLAVQGQVWAGYYGVWYRQTSRLIRQGVLVAYDLCGNGSEVGQFTIDDWAWAPDLALSQECPPLPEPNLPEAQCVIPPCDGFSD